MNPDPKAIVRRVLSVASLPQIYLKVEDVLKDPRSSNRDLALVIEGDPALTVKILRISNSAFYGCAAKVETVDHAITVLGTQQLRELVLACSVLKAFKGVPEDLIDMEEFWRHSLACGVAARILASLRYESNVERYFVAGLLHDIGRLILLMQLPDSVAEVFAQARKIPSALYQKERELLGFHHATLGAMLLKSWRLSERLVEGVAFHHEPHKAKHFPIDAAILHVANIVANSMAMGSSGEIFVPKLDTYAWQALGIDDSGINDMLGMLQEQYQDAVNFILES